MVWLPPFPPWLKRPDKPAQTNNGVVVRLTKDQLEPGDVLLSYSDFTAANWVRYLDEGGYSHAALFDGEQVIEAASPEKGIRLVSLHLHLAEAEYVDVYRYGRTPEDDLSSDERAAVAAAGQAFLGRYYGTLDAALVGLLAITRKVDLPGGGEESLRAVLDRAVEWLQNGFASARGWLTCSELVYRAYLETPPPETHRLEIAPLHPDTPERIRALLSESKLEAAGTDAAQGVEALKERFAELYVEQWPRGIGVAGDAKIAAVGGEDGPVADYVTPRDLENSPSLRPIGRAFKQDYPKP